MASAEKPVLMEILSAALDSLMSAGRKPTVRAVQDKVREMGGDYSLSTIHAHLQQLKTKPSPTVFTPGEKFMPLVKAASDLVKVEIETATAALRGDLDIANNDLETLGQNLLDVESSLAEAVSKIADLEQVISELRAELKVSGDFLATANNELERARTELARNSYREEEYQKALAAAAEARERAAMLAGRIEGIESQQKIQVTAPQEHEPHVAGKKKAPSKK